jgi:hypothetical protein
MASCTSQHNLLLDNLLKYYKENDNIDRMLAIINGDVKLSLRIVDWFTTNYAKKYYTVYSLDDGRRFKVYNDYKLKLKSYSKKRFDPFCRWDRISIPYSDGKHVQTTVGQLNFFKWAFENNVVEYIEKNYAEIENDMNGRNSTSKNKPSVPGSTVQKTRKKREELSISASKTIKREDVEIMISFN